MKIALMKTTKEVQVSAAKRAFILGLIDLSWRLAAVFIVPFFIGMALGNSTAGIIIGTVCAILFIIKLGIDSNKVTE